MEAKSSPEQPASDVIDTVVTKPLLSAAPGGGGPGVTPGRYAIAGRIRSASRSRMSTRTARSPQTRNPAARYRPLGTSLSAGNDVRPEEARNGTSSSPRTASTPPCWSAQSWAASARGAGFRDWGR